MRDLLELQTGQLAFISGLMSGFSLSVAVHVLRSGIRGKVAQLVFVLFLIASLMFLVALYVDVRLTIELAGFKTLPDNVVKDIVMIRNLGTLSATVALLMFIVATGLLGWIATPATGVITTLIGGGVLYTFWYLWTNINSISLMLQKI